MNLRIIIFLIGIVLIFLKWKKFIVIHNLWIILCFVLFFVLSYIHIHNKNKQNRTPKPVYLVRKS